MKGILLVVRKYESSNNQWVARYGYAAVYSSVVAYTCKKQLEFLSVFFL